MLKFKIKNLKSKIPDIHSPWLHVIILAALALPFFINLGASAIWDGSEAFYAETPREMLESGDWLSPSFNYEPRVNKPPLTYWAVAISYKIFGVNEFAARLPGVFAALGVMLFSWGAARSFYGPRAALFAAAIAAVAPRVFIIGRRLPIDIILLFFLTGALFFLLRAINIAINTKEAPVKNSAANRRLAYIFIALGFMTKGPVAVVIPAGALLAWMLYAGRFRMLLSVMRPLEGAAIFLCIALPWYILIYLTHGWDYIALFFLSDNLGRFASESFGPSRGFFYYILVWFSDFFPWSFIGPAALISLRKGFRERLRDASFGLPLFWCAFVFLMFSLSKNKQEYYIAPIYPAAAILIAGLLDKLGRHNRPDAPDVALAGHGKYSAHGGFGLWRRLYVVLAFLM
ncbi:MAG: glycosyltransferase family 39 protein, partial [Acidobacteriota bacterium]|nr:glycosyltransferase family 39 protein [Acidobacteriota bacterium]